MYPGFPEYGLPSLDPLQVPDLAFNLRLARQTHNDLALFSCIAQLRHVWGELHQQQPQPHRLCQLHHGLRCPWPQSIRVGDQDEYLEDEGGKDSIQCQSSARSTGNCSLMGRYLTFSQSMEMGLFGSRSLLLQLSPSSKVCSDLWCYHECPVWRQYQWPRIYASEILNINLPCSNNSNLRCPTWLSPDLIVNWSCGSPSVTFVRTARQLRHFSSWLGRTFGLRLTNFLLIVSSRNSHYQNHSS